MLAWFELAADEEADPKRRRPGTSRPSATRDSRWIPKGDREERIHGDTEGGAGADAPAGQPLVVLLQIPRSGDPETDLQGGTVPPLVNRAIRNSARQAALSGDTDTPAPD